MTHSMVVKVKPLVPALTSNQLNQIRAQLIINPRSQTFNPLLGFLTNSSAPENGLLLYNHMLHHPPSHNHYTFTYALRACSLLRSYAKGLEIHAHVTKSGHSSDIFIQNSLLHFYLVEKDVFSASQLFQSISFPDVVSWTSIISGLSKCGFEAEAIAKFSLMDVKPNSATLVSVLSACSSLRALRLGKAVHAYSLGNLSDNNIVLDNSMLDFYVKCGSLVSAEYLFVKMPNRDVVSWTTMVDGYAKMGHCEEAIGVFKNMVQEGETEPNEATLVTVLTASSSRGALSLGQWVHSYVGTRCDIAVEGNLGNALINMYVKCGHMSAAIQVFNRLLYKDIISWDTIISGMAVNGRGKQALQLFSQMLVNGVLPDDVTFISLLSACSHAGLVDEGSMFFKSMRYIYGIVPSLLHYGCMVDMYGRAGFLEEAEAFIRDMPEEAEGPIWGSLLQACKSHGNENMFERIKQYLLNNGDVSMGTLALLSNAYASLDRWDDADKVRKAMRGRGLKKMAGSSWIELDTSTNRRNVDEYAGR